MQRAIFLQGCVDGEEKKCLLGLCGWYKKLDIQHVWWGTHEDLQTVRGEYSLQGTAARLH